MSRCQCLTLTGKQCSRNASKGSNYCLQHKNCKGGINLLQSIQPIIDRVHVARPINKPLPQIPPKKIPVARPVNKPLPKPIRTNNKPVRTNNKPLPKPVRTNKKPV